MKGLGLFLFYGLISCSFGLAGTVRESLMEQTTFNVQLGSFGRNLGLSRSFPSRRCPLGTPFLHVGVGREKEALVSLD